VFFGFHKYSSVGAMLIELGLPSCNTVMHNAKDFATGLGVLQLTLTANYCNK